MVPLNIVTKEACDPGCHGNLEYHCAASLQMNVHWPKVHAQGENTTIPLRACSNFGVLTVFCNSFYRVITHAYICNKSSTPSLVQSGLSQSQEPVVRCSGHQNDHNYNLNATTVNEPFGIYVDLAVSPAIHGS